MKSKLFFLKNVGTWVGQKAPKKIFPISYVVMNYSLITPGSGSAVYTISIQSSRIWIFAPKMVDFVFHFLSTVGYQGPVPILARKFKAKKMIHLWNGRVGNLNKLFKYLSCQLDQCLIELWKSQFMLPRVNIYVSLVKTLQNWRFLVFLRKNPIYFETPCTDDKWSGWYSVPGPWCFLY